MSVALLDQGEIVPARGSTEQRWHPAKPPVCSAPALPSSRRLRQRRFGGSGQRCGEFHEIQIAGRDARHTRGTCARISPEQPVQPEDGECGAARPDRAGTSLARIAGPARRVDGAGNGVTLPASAGGDLADALLLDFVDPQDRVHREIGAPYAGKLGLDALLGRVQHDGAALTEYQALDLDEAE